MLTLESQVTVDGVTGRDITEFLACSGDETYQAWWPGTHLAFHVLEPGPDDGHVGDVVWMDEYIGTRHVRMAAEVQEVLPGEKLVWQVRMWRLRLPIRITLALHSHDHGVQVRHTISAGWTGRARVLDPLWRLYFTRSFAHAMDRHVHTEFTLFGAQVRRQARDTLDVAPGRTPPPQHGPGGGSRDGGADQWRGSVTATPAASETTRGRDRSKVLDAPDQRP